MLYIPQLYLRGADNWHLYDDYETSDRSNACHCLTTLTTVGKITNKLTADNARVMQLLSGWHIVVVGSGDVRVLPTMNPKKIVSTWHTEEGHS